MVLGIDTSAENLGLAICRDGNIIFSSLSRPGLRHGEILQKVMDDFLFERGVDFSDLTGVSVTIGPGSFTGLRIGLSAAKGYSYSLGIPLAGVSTLLAGAYAHSNLDRKVLVVIDAKRKEFYWAIFDCSDRYPKRLSRDSIGSLGDLREMASENVIFFGPSHLEELFLSEIKNCEYHVSDDFNLAITASRLGEQDIINGRNIDTATVVPFYLRSRF
jgi:tRNA threonylcarbamoyladenosine biosynthesis protein TsaB